MKNDNRGFSLIELIVVITIMTILTVGIAMSISAVTNKKVKATVDEIKSELSYTQSLAMSKKMAYGEIVVKEDGYYYFDIVYGTNEMKKKEEKLYKTSDIQISYVTNQDDGNSKGTTVDESHPCILSFVKSSGAFQPMLTVDDPINEPEVYSFREGVYCKKIIVTSKSGYSQELELFPNTGTTRIKK